MVATRAASCATPGATRTRTGRVRPPTSCFWTNPAGRTEVALALTVAVLLTTKGPVYRVELVVGNEPSKV